MSSIRDFSCIGGLENQIRIVKETVLFPLMYGEVYAKFNLKPPRGLLFYGPPGTGKTLVASALASECSNAERKVSFISRQGSDCLSKWVGESEKKLQKIFSMAEQSKPCIIFFDEIDGLAPVRSSRQDFVHASIVSTLLALMDGLENNSEIIVIGATNRVDALDPALRRPGRFDRELYFPLPCCRARKDILSVHIKSWKQKPTQRFLSYLASKSVGYCGSDLQALCAEAVMCCVRRNYPEIYTTKSKHYINDRHLKVEKEDFLTAKGNIEPASHRVAIMPVKCLSVKIQPLLQQNLSNIMSQVELLCPQGMIHSGNVRGRVQSRSNNSPRILLCGDDDSHTRHLGPALLHGLEHLPCHVLDATALFEETGRAVEESIIQKIKAARRSVPSLLYVPDILAWWDLVDDLARVVFTSILDSLDRSVHMLVLSTANCSRQDLPSQISHLFDGHRGEVFEIALPDLHERQLFFKQLFSNASHEFESNCSSQENIVQIMSPTRTQGNAKGKTDLQADVDAPSTVYERNASSSRKKRFKTRNKLYTVRSDVSADTPKTTTNIKRKNNAAGEGPASKRSKSSSTATLSTHPLEKLPDFEVEELLEKLVISTEGWSCHYLERLYSSIEMATEKPGEDFLTVVNECLNHYRKLGEVKRRTEVQDG